MTNIILFTRYNRKPDYRDAHVALSNEAWGILRKFIIESVPGNLCPRDYRDIDLDIWLGTYDDQDNKPFLTGNKKFKFAPHCAMLNGGVSCSYISEGPLF